MGDLQAAIRRAASLTERAPTDAQKESGNYAKGKVRLHGLDIAIENPKGGERSGTDKGGKRWSVKMPAHYGYVKGTEGKDGDHVDVYIGPQPDSSKVFVVDQVDASSGKFDEHKCMLGYGSKADALADYKKAFSDGKGADRIGNVTELSIDTFKSWLRSGKTKQPMAQRAYATGGSVMKHDDKISKALYVARRMNGGRTNRKGYAEGGGELPEQGEPYAETRKEPGWLNATLPGTKGKNIKDFLGLMRDEVTNDPSTAMSFTGIPTALQGYGELTDPEGDNLRKVAGASKIAMGALPFSRFAGPVGRAVEGLTSTAPRAIASYGALGLGADAENTFPAIQELVGGRKARAGEAQASEAQASEAQAADRVPVPGEFDVAEASGEAKPKREKPPLPVAPVEPKMFEGDKRSKLTTTQIQKEAQAAGFYDGKIDGDDGGATRQAELRLRKKEFNDAMAGYERQMHLYNEQLTLFNKEAEGEAKQASGEALDKYYREKSPYLTAAEIGLPLVSAAAAGWLGNKLGRGTVAKVGAREAQQATEADAIMKAYRDKNPLGKRVGDINDYWTKGGSDMAFKPAGRTPFWQRNPAAEPATELYNPGWRGADQASNAGYALGLGSMFGIPTYYMMKKAEKNLEDARAAVAAGANAGNLAALQQAEIQAAGWDTLFRGELGATAGKLTAAYPMYKLPRQAPKSTARAEDKRLAVTEELTGKAAAARAKEAKAKAKKPPKPPKGGGPGGVTPLLPLSAAQLLQQGSGPEEQSQGEQASALPISDDQDQVRQSGGKVEKHYSNYQPRRDGKFAGGPVYPKRKNGGATSQPQGDIGYDSGGWVGKLLGALPLANLGMLGRRKDTPQPNPDRFQTENTYVQPPADYGNDPAVGELFKKRERAMGGNVGANNAGLISTGLVHGATGGRADARPVDVRSGSFVIPADCVAALGTGNTMAGAALLDKTFKKRPRAMGGMNMATGGDVPIRISDGEYLLDPEQVYEVGSGDMNRGHQILDKLVLRIRDKHIRDLSKLPPPARS